MLLNAFRSHRLLIFVLFVISVCALRVYPQPAVQQNDSSFDFKNPFFTLANNYSKDSALSQNLLSEAGNRQSFIRNTPEIADCSKFEVNAGQTIPASLPSTNDCSSNGRYYDLKSSNGQFVGVGFGQNGDKPVAADYDGDGRADAAVFRNGVWYILPSTSGLSFSIQFGLATDKAVPNAFIR